MRASALICAVAGHTWSQPKDVHESYPFFRCERCGREQEFADGTRRIDKAALKGDFQKSVGPFGGPRG